MAIDEVELDLVGLGWRLADAGEGALILDGAVA